MKRRANATLIGAFVVGGLVLLAAAVIAVAGGKLFTRKERAVMHFGGSVYGLQVGAPVVFRGVRVGSVASISVFYDKAKDNFTIPVVAELERDAMRGLDGVRAGADEALPALVARGLRAQLSMQSLLTGQLYVDLDLRPDQPPAVRGAYRDAVEIPTAATAMQNLKSQLDGVDFRRLIDDVSAIAASARALVGGPQLKQALDDLQQITGSVKRLSARLEQRMVPLTDEAQGALSGARRAMDRVGGAADGVRDTARRFDKTADNAAALLAPDAPLVRNVQSAADELTRTAAALRQATADDSNLARNTERALQDVSRASRAVRELADLLERHPEALLRGRPTGAAPP